MNRMTKLFSMASDVAKNNLRVILIQIDEAHSSAWPLSIDSIFNVEQPEPHKSFENRLERANHFINKYKPPYEVYVDTWNNEFAETFKAWPDRYHFIDKDYAIVAKSEYYNDTKREAIVIEDCTDVLTRLML